MASLTERAVAAKVGTMLMRVSLAEPRPRTVPATVPHRSPGVLAGEQKIPRRAHGSTHRTYPTRSHIRSPTCPPSKPTSPDWSSRTASAKRTAAPGSRVPATRAALHRSHRRSGAPAPFPSVEPRPPPPGLQLRGAGFKARPTAPAPVHRASPLPGFGSPDLTLGESYVRTHHTSDRASARGTTQGTVATGPARGGRRRERSSTRPLLGDHAGHRRHPPPVCCCSACGSRGVPTPRHSQPGRA